MVWEEGSREASPYPDFYIFPQTHPEQKVVQASACRAVQSHGQSRLSSRPLPYMTHQPKKNPARGKRIFPNIVN